MSYQINAWLDHGEPRLGIVNAQTGVIQQLWRLSKISSPRGEPVRRESQRELWRGLSRRQQSGIQQLTKELFLLGCAEDISLVQRAQAGNMGNTCLSCGGCAEDAEDIAMAATMMQYANPMKQGAA